MDDKFINLENVTFSYKKGKMVFKDFSLSLDRNSISVILGENGSGKTTLTKLIMGILSPQKGEILIEGKSNHGVSLGEMGKSIGYLFQNPDHQIFGSSVMEQLTWSSSLVSNDNENYYEKAKYLLKEFGIENIKDTYPFYLSMGEKRILAIASVMMRDVKYLIFDEPTSSLDSNREEVLVNMLLNLKQRGIGALVITHDYDFSKRIGQRIIHLEDGRIEDELI